MKINSLNSHFQPSIRFSSLRTDKTQIEELKKGEKPILDNKKENILTALNNMTVNPERKSVEFLLDVAKNLQYGQNGNSEFKDIIDDTTDIKTERENTDWSKILSETISKVLSSSTGDVSDLEAEYQEIFNTKQPLTQEQRELLELRSDLKQQVLGEETLDDADSLTRAARISKNIDFFISSSEIPMGQRKRCLELFQYLLSDDYKITPQLKDKKLQVMDEMINDMLIKTPEQDALTIKSVNQLYTGMCAAISVCRKNIAYEDKVRYMELIMEELKDSPVMEVYDVTNLESGNKVNIPKIYIDYNTAMDMGYRIIDASVHNWMQNAHALGDGTIQSEDYVAFDQENYGIFNDASWYEGISPEFAPEKKLLISLIKEKESLSSVLSYRKKMKNAAAEIDKVKRQSVEIQTAINGKFNELFSSIFPEMSKTELGQLPKKIMTFYKGVQDTNEQNISAKMPNDVKQIVVADFIKSETNATEEQAKAIDEKAKTILSLTQGYISADNDIAKLKKFNSKKGNYTYYKKLYQLAAAHRVSTEADINLKDGIVRFERISGLPTRDKQIISHLKSIQPKLAKESVREQFSTDGSQKTQEELEKQLMTDIVSIETVIPAQLNSISENLLGVSIKDYAKNLFSGLSKKIRNGNPELMNNVAMALSVKADKDKVLSVLDKWVDKLENSDSDADLQEAIRILGFEDRMQMMQVFVTSFMNSLKEGVTEEQFAELAERFGGEDKVIPGINTERERFVRVFNKYNSIIEKWNVPDARTNILVQMEKEKSVMPEAKLRTLQKRFDYIAHKISENDSIQNMKQREKANAELFKFTPEEIEILQSIEKQIPTMKKYAKMEYAAINKALYNELEAMYSNLGKLSGQFWVREEGSSGLTSNEQVRIFEQMTGKPYHVSHDIEKAAEHIKKGDGSGVISYSVSDDDYGFHAQYVPSVTTEVFEKPLTGEKEVKDIIWTDNSWGKSEREYFWNGKDGFNYTDYGRGFGWKKGFVLADDMRIGLSVDDIKTSVGVESEHGDKFELLADVVLPGMPADAYQKLYKMFNYILTMNEGQEYFNALESALKAQDKELDIKFLESLDGIAENRTTALEKRVDKEFKSKEDYEKLPDTDPLKLVMETLSLYLSTKNPTLADSVLTIKSLDELKERKQEIIDGHVEEMGAIISKTDACVEQLSQVVLEDILNILRDVEIKYGVSFVDEKKSALVSQIFFDTEEMEKLDGSFSSLKNYLLNQVVKVSLDYFEDEAPARYFIENVQKLIDTTLENNFRITSLDCAAIKTSPLAEEFISAVDKYLNPKSDEDLLSLIQGLQEAPYEVAEKFFESLKPEDLGLDIKSPYDLIVKLQMDDAATKKAFGEVIATGIILSGLEEKGIEDKSDDEEDINAASPEVLYRNLYIKLTDMDVQKYIKGFKSEFFKKYKVRQAFPQAVVLTDDAIGEQVGKLFELLKQHVAEVKTCDTVIDIYSDYENIISKYESTGFFDLLSSGKSIKIDNKEDMEALKQFQSEIRTFANKAAAYPSGVFQNAAEQLKNMAALLTPENGIVETKKALKLLNAVSEIFMQENNGVPVKNLYIDQRNANLKEMNDELSIYIMANVDPAYRNKAKEQLKTIVSLMKNGADEEKIELAEDKLGDLLVEKHIVKNPTVLLKECVRMMQDGKTETDEYLILKEYLSAALTIAQQTKVQYKLVQNAHEGIVSKTRELLPLFKVTYNNGQEKSMDSEEGLLYLMSQMQNSNDKNETLRLFLSMSGLSQRAVSALIHNFDISKSKEIVDEKYNETIKDIADLNELSAAIAEFMEKNRIPRMSMELTINQMMIYVKRKLKNPNNNIFNSYMEFMNSIKKSDEIKQVSRSMIDEVIYSLNASIMETLAGNTNAKIDYIADFSDYLKEKKDMLDSIDIPADCDAGKEKLEFNSQYEKIDAYIKEKLHAITSLIENSSTIRAEYK